MANINAKTITIGSNTLILQDGGLRESVGVAGGLASLDSQGKLPTSQLPTSSGFLTDYNFTHTTVNSTATSGNITVTFAANQRCSRMILVNGDVNIAVVCNNLSDNYIWIKNSGSSDVDVTISGITLNNAAIAAANIHIAGSAMSVPAGGIIEIGIVCNADGAFITSRNDL